MCLANIKLGYAPAYTQIGALPICFYFYFLSATLIKFGAVAVAESGVCYCIYVPGE